MTASVALIADKVRRADQREQTIRQLGRFLRDAELFISEGKGRDAARTMTKVRAAVSLLLDDMETVLARIDVNDAPSERLAQELLNRFRNQEEDVRAIVLRLAADMCAQSPLPSRKEKTRGRS